MQRVLEASVLALGATSLFLVAFVGFAASSGVPLEDVAVVGRLFSKGEAQSVEPAPPGEPPVEQLPRTDHEVIQSNLGVLAAFRLPSPYTGEGLQRLADELKAKRFDLDRRESAVSEREGLVTQREDAVSNQLQLLEDLRADLERRAKELEQRAAEVQRDEGAAAAKDASVRKARAELFATGDPEELSPRLLQFSPEEAGRILRSLGGERAKLILDALPGADWKTYADAYARGTD
jgi:hypothetical protein